MWESIKVCFLSTFHVGQINKRRRRRCRCLYILSRLWGFRKYSTVGWLRWIRSSFVTSIQPTNSVHAELSMSTIPKSIKASIWTNINKTIFFVYLDGVYLHSNKPRVINAFKGYGSVLANYQI